MIEERVISETSIWAPAQCPFRIEYSNAVLERIRASVTESFYALPRGGLEAGGVLFGAQNGASMCILAHRPLECEHARGPSFSLSEADRARLNELLAAAPQDPDLEGMEPLGWYHSHTRSEIFLSEADVALHNKCFPSPWQVALVVRPYHARPARAGFFFREGDGSIRTSGTYQEFELAPLPLALTGQDAEPEPERPPEPEPPRVPWPEVQAEPSGFDCRTLPLPRSVREQSKRRLTAGLIAAVLVLLAATAGAWFFFPALQKLLARKPEAIGLNALDINDHLWVRWDSTSRPVSQAVSGVLQVTQEGTKVRIDLDRVRLRQGGATVPRRAERVDLRLTLRQPGGNTAEELASFVAPMPERQPSKEEIEALRQRDELARETDLMRAEMRAQSLRTRRLERTLGVLKSQLDDERTARQAEMPEAAGSRRQ